MAGPFHTHIHIETRPLPCPNPQPTLGLVLCRGPGQTSGQWNKQDLNVDRQRGQLEPCPQREEGMDESLKA